VPVIKLRYSNEGAVAWGDPHPSTERTHDHVTAGKNGGSVANPFNKGVHIPLMAEEASAASVNGWVLGAIASAVTGLALLGYSQRKTTVATSVPV